VGGLPNGGDVRVNGIKVGTVIDQRIDPDSYNAVVHMSIRPNVRLPSDSVATIASDGLLGGKYVKLEPGRSNETIAPGGMVTKTKNYKSLEETVGEIIFLATDKGSGSSSATSGAPGPAAPPIQENKDK
jgi:phospholipid/cholesterol/gamma-HCH transport system substrate-binding protein